MRQIFYTNKGNLFALRNVTEGSTTYSWLDLRLRYPGDVPPPAVLTGTTATTVQQWSVPIAVDGAPAALSGTVQWVPRALATSQLQAVRPATQDGTSGRSRTLAGVSAVLIGAGLAAAAAVLLKRRRRP